MNAEYRFKYDDALVAESLKRYRMSHPTRMLRWAMKSFGFIGLALLAAVGVAAKSPPITGIFVFFIALLAASPVFDYRLAKRRLRQSPFYNSDVVVRFSTDGYLSQDPQSRTELAWSTFAEGCRLRDGFLLFLDAQHFYWFSDRALVSGDVAEVESMLKQKLKRFRIAEHL
jgi:hypothetical protein